MTARIAVVVFPGVNCEHDVVDALARLGARPELVWHTRTDLRPYDAVVLPGGFAHGDYLRPGALARLSPVMAAIGDHAASGGPVLGICNGFQVLCEAGLLPGALQKNAGLQFVCDTVPVVLASSRGAITEGMSPGTRLELPVNHFSGNFTCDVRTLDELRARDQIVLRYLENPNGSVDDIAAVSNPEGNVVGCMPHPERAVDPLLGGTDGEALLRSLIRRAASGLLAPT